MFIVLGFFYFSHDLNRQKHNLIDNDKPSKFIAFIVFAYIVFWVGMRNGYIDTASYINSFNRASWADISSLNFSFNSGWGFSLLEILFKRFISSNYQAWLMFIAIISGMCVAKTFYRYSQNYFYSVFLFLATADFTWMMNGIRQFLVVAMLLVATPLIEQNKTFKYILLILLCSTIHGTALLMIPVYFFVKAKPWTFRNMLLFALVLFVLFFTSSFTDLLTEAFSETKYNNLEEHFSEDNGVNILRVLLYSVTTILAFFARKKLPEDDIKINIFVNMSFVTTCLYLIAMPTSGILLGRLPIYTQLYQYILLPYVIDKLFEQKTKTLVYIVSILCFLLYFSVASDNLYYKSAFTGIIH